MTNFEKINQMPPEEFAKWIDRIVACHNYGSSCNICPIGDVETCEPDGITKWLNTQAKEENSDD